LRVNADGTLEERIVIRAAGPPVDGVSWRYERSAMSHRLMATSVTTGVGVAVLASSLAAGQGVVMQRNMSLAMATTIAQATLAECKAKGYNTSAAVVDRAGQVIVLMRNEQATAQTLEMARRKAYTARMFRMTTLEFQKRTMDPALAPQRQIA